MCIFMLDRLGSISINELLFVFFKTSKKINEVPFRIKELSTTVAVVDKRNKHQLSASTKRAVPVTWKYEGKVAGASLVRASSSSSPSPSPSSSHGITVHSWRGTFLGGRTFASHSSAISAVARSKEGKLTLRGVRRRGDWAPHAVNYGCLLNQSPLSHCESLVSVKVASQRERGKVEKRESGGGGDGGDKKKEGNLISPSERVDQVSRAISTSRVLELAAENPQKRRLIIISSVISICFLMLPICPVQKPIFAPWHRHPERIHTQATLQLSGSLQVQTA